MGGTVRKTQAEWAETRAGPFLRTGGRVGGETYPRDSGWALGYGSGGLPGGAPLWLEAEGPVGKAGQLRTRVAPRPSPLPGTALTCVPGVALSSCGGGGGNAAPVCWMNCCRLHCRSSLFSSSSS